MMDINGAKFGDEVRELLFEVGITQSQLARELDITPSYLSDILSNKRISRRRRFQIVKLLESMLESMKAKEMLNQPATQG